MYVCMYVILDFVFESYAGSNNKMRGNEMGWECSTYEEEENRILVQGFDVSARKEETIWKNR